MNIPIPKSVIGFLVVFGIFLFSSTTFARTEITGTIVKNTKWTADQSPYVLSGEVVVGEGTSLAIEKNVIVLFSRGSQFQVKGHLDAYRVFFNGFLEANNEEILTYLPNSQGSLIRCAFLDVGLVFDTSGVRLTSSAVSNRNGTGVTIGNGAAPHISETSFHDNSYFAVYHKGKSPLNILNCYWGSKTGPSGEGDGDGDSVSANVLYSPFQTKEKISFLILSQVVVQTGKDESDEGIEITYYLFNINDTAHEAVLGASLHGPNNIVYHHSDSDIHTSIPFGFHRYTRMFKLPSHAREGNYAVHCGIMNKNLSGYYSYVKHKGRVKFLGSRLYTEKERLPDTDSEG